MDRYDPPYTITDGMLERVASISEKLGRISTARGLEISRSCAETTE